PSACARSSTSDRRPAHAGPPDTRRRTAATWPTCGCCAALPAGTDSSAVDHRRSRSPAAPGCAHHFARIGSSARARRRYYSIHHQTGTPHMFSSFSIGKRLGIGFAALALLILVMGGFAADRMGRAQDMVLDLTHESVPAVRELGAMATALAEYRVSERGLVSSVGDAAKMEEYGSELVAG